MAILTAPTTSNSAAQRAAIASSGQPTRFTRDGSDQLEQHLASICDQFRAGVQAIVPARKLEALMLGGGYGRGEGGVLRTETGDQAYNDLEFYVCIRGNRHFNRWCYGFDLHKLAGSLSPAAGVDVEFKIISLAELRRSTTTMFYYDLVMGHHWLSGAVNSIHGCEHHRDARNIPLSEVTRLLMNRCSGLLFARERLEREPFTAEDADFVGRNLAKAQLAFGDAALASFGLYHWSCLERHKRLLRLTARESLAWLPAACDHHAAGVRFKLHPYRTQSSPAMLEARYDELCVMGISIWLWLEGRRLNCTFQSAREYAMSSTNKCPGTNPWRNRLLNLKAFGPAVFFAPKTARNPRERLLNALALLLWEPWSSDPALLRRLQGELRVPGAAMPEQVARIYQSLWAQFN
jgi:hypothetical protein